MITGNDLPVLVRLVARPCDWTFRSLGAELQMDPAAVHRSVTRLKRANLLDEDRQPIRGNVAEFLIHALRYLVPAEPGPLGRGTPTAWGAAPLAGLVVGGDEPVPVWPDPKGDSRGPLVEPVAKGVPRLARDHPELGEWFALIDALRLGRARERKLAAERLEERIWAGRAEPDEH